MPDKPLAAVADSVDQLRIASTIKFNNVQAVDDKLFQDQFDGELFVITERIMLDDYFDDYDFEDRPVLPESPRLNEFDTNTYPPRIRLPTITDYQR